MAPLTRKRKTLNRGNEEAVDENSEDWGPAIPSAGAGAGSRRQLKQSQRKEDDTSMATSGNMITSKKGGKKPRTNTLEAKRSVEKMAEELKNYIEAEMCSTPQTEELSLLEVVASVEMSGEAFNFFPYRKGACQDDKTTVRHINNETYQSAMLLLAEYREAAREYDQLSEGSGTAKMPSWLRWEKDSADLQELNQRMLAIATTFVEHQVVPRSTEVEPEPGQDDVEQIAWELLEDAHAQQGVETWGSVAETMMQNMCGIMILLT
ncbi:hypothetical protein E4U55_004488 [Claviceps digitariae]|nr:hypothetical protein E4U55_004488 [Claviceps digitariae]